MVFINRFTLYIDFNRPGGSHWQTLSHNIVSSTPRLSGIRSHNVSGERYWLHDDHDVPILFFKFTRTVTHFRSWYLLIDLHCILILFMKYQIRNQLKVKFDKITYKVDRYSTPDIDISFQTTLNHCVLLWNNR
jgi:hypothetical protein